MDPAHRLLSAGLLVLLGGCATDAALRANARADRLDRVERAWREADGTLVVGIRASLGEEPRKHAATMRIAAELLPAPCARVAAPAEQALPRSARETEIEVPRSALVRTEDRAPADATEVAVRETDGELSSEKLRPVEARRETIYFHRSGLHGLYGSNELGFVLVSEDPSDGETRCCRISLSREQRHARVWPLLLLPATYIVDVFGILLACVAAPFHAA